MGAKHTPIEAMPQAVELEMAVLGALMLDREAFAIVDATLKPGNFYLEAHRHIYAAISALAERCAPVDMLTVTEELKKSGLLESAGGGYYLVELSNRVASAANIEYHARIIKQRAIQREIIFVGMAAQRSGHDDTQDVFDQLDTLEKSVYAIGHGAFQKSATRIGSAVSGVLKAAEAAARKKGMTGIPAGIQEVDRHTGGWQDTDLVVIAARPGMGKTGYAISLAIAAAKSGLPVQFFTLEMSEHQIAQRMVAQVSGTGISGMRTGVLSDQDWAGMTSAAEALHSMPILIDDTAAITLSELRSKARRAVSRDGVRMIVVDYLQLMGGPEKTAIERVGNNITGLKALAKELNVPILVLSQLSRAVEARGGSKRPQLSDLRETGQIEQDADMVQFLYRPEYYGIMEDENGANLAGVCELIFAKYRNGATGTVLVGFKDTTASFYSLSEAQYLSAPETQFPSAQPFEINVITSARPMNDQDIPF